MRAIGILALVNSLQQKLIFNYLNRKPTVVIPKSNQKRHYSFFFSKRNIKFLGKKNVSLKTRLHCITMDKEQAE